MRCHNAVVRFFGSQIYSRPFFLSSFVLWKWVFWFWTTDIIWSWSKTKWNKKEMIRNSFSNHRSHALMYWPNIHGLDGMGQIKWVSTFGMYADSWCEMMVIWNIITTRKFTQIAIEDWFFSFPLFRCWSFLLLFVLFYLFCRRFEICHEFFFIDKFDCLVVCFWWEIKTKVFFNFCLTFVALELNCIIVVA